MVLLTLLLTKTVFASTYKAEWKQCQIDSNCIITEGACGKDSVNSKFEKEFSQYIKEIKPQVECDAESLKPVKQLPYCNAKKNVCKLKLL